MICDYYMFLYKQINFTIRSITYVPNICFYIVEYCQLFDNITWLTITLKNYIDYPNLCAEEGNEFCNLLYAGYVFAQNECRSAICTQLIQKVL